MTIATTPIARQVYQVQVQENQIEIEDVNGIDTDEEFDEYWNSKDVLELIDDLETGRTKLARVVKHFKDDLLYTPPGTILRQVRDRSHCLSGFQNELFRA